MLPREVPKPQPRRWPGLALAAVLLAGCGGVAARPLAPRPGLSIVSVLRPGVVRRFRFHLQRDQYLALLATQDAVDVVLTLHLPDGAARAPVDTQSALPVPEVLRVVAPFDGIYVLEVAAADAGASGAFRLELLELRPARARDRLVSQAEEELAEAERLRRRGHGAADRRALPLYARAVRRFALAADAGREGYARVQWARVLERQGRRQEEAACLHGALALPAAAQAPGVRAKAATMLGATLSALGDEAAADAADREAMAQWQRLRRPAFEAEAVNDMAHHAAERGELAVAEGLYRRALDLWRASGRPSRVAVAVLLGNLAGVYSVAGEPQMALDTADQALAAWPGGPPEALAEILARKGDALAELGRAEESRAVLAAAVELCAARPAARAQLERRLGRRAYDQGDYDEAARHQRSALASLEAAQDFQSAAAVRQDLAWTELKRGRLADAERLFTQASGAAAWSVNRWMKAAALAGRARLERARGHLQTAVALALQALDAVELLRREVGRTDLKTSVFAGQQFYFRVAADLVLELYRRTGERSRLVEAFDISERSRARRLLDLLAAPPGATVPPSPAPAAVAELDRGEARLRALRAEGAADPEIAAAEREVRRQVLALRRAEAPAGVAAAGFGGSPLPFADIQQWLDADTALLEFDLGEDASRLWVVTRRGLAVRRLPRGRQVEAAARQAFALLSRPGVSADGLQARAILLAVSRLLLGGAPPEAAAARRWLVVMDGALHGLPLTALPNPARPGEPLLVRHEIVYAPSASVAVRLAERATRRRQAGEPAGRELAVFADPVYAGEERPAAAAPAASLPDASGCLLQLPRLLHAAEEARRILALVPAAARLDAERYAATKARVLSGELAAYRRLHFAVHGLADEEQPELSGLALAMLDPRGRPLDGILFAHEIARLDLPADLVVLSACRSGRGAAIPGEGLVGLVHAFLTAGASRVVASNWPVNDQATAELMALFYEGLLDRRLPPARALQAAQLALAGDTPWRRPYYWAAFALHGGF